MQLPPIIRCLLLCEDVDRDSKNPQRISLRGLSSTIQSLEHPKYPLLFREICVFVQLTECVGSADFYVQIYHLDSGDLIFRTKKQQFDFGDDPLQIRGLSFRIQNCLFPSPGLYTFEFCYNGVVEAEAYLLMR